MVITRSSNLIGKITVLVMVGLCVNTALALDGSGTEADPWRIQSLDDFNDFAADANYWDDYTRLEADVNLAGLTYSTAVIAPDVNNANTWFDGTAFTGVFDGDDHKITNLSIDDAGANKYYLGLFGYIGEDGEVRNLGLEGGSVSGDKYVGGLVGWSLFANISNCYSTCDVIGYSFVGGLVGAGVCTISNSYSTGDVNGGGSVGGLMGYSERYSSISSCYSTGDVNGGFDVGGLMGGNGGRVSNCYSSGDVNGVGFVGGLVGYNFFDIINCYSTGDVNGVDFVGGLVGRNLFNVSNSFWDIETQTHGITESIGSNDGPFTNVEGLPTAQMQTISTFTDADWDFTSTWNIGENQTYPYLRVYRPSDINKDRIVNFLDLAIITQQWLEER